MPKPILTIDSKNIFIYPQRPSKYSVIYQILNHLGYKTSKSINKNFRIAINWEDTTFRKSYDILENLNKIKRVINVNCKDISKTKVDDIFNETFGYKLNVNPLYYYGKCLRKNNLNAKKDGKIIHCPIKKNNLKYVYQKVINNKVNRYTAEDIRVPIFNETIPLVFLKYRSMNKRFSDDFDRSIIANHKKIFSNEEIKKIIIFCKKIGLDYGEIDVLRNRDDGRIYILDANNTPWGPPDELTINETRVVIAIFSKVFHNEFLEN